MAQYIGSVQLAKTLLQEHISATIQSDGIPASFSPLVFCVSGSGHVAKVFLFGHEFIPRVLWMHLRCFHMSLYLQRILRNWSPAEASMVRYALHHLQTPPSERRFSCAELRRKTMFLTRMDCHSIGNTIIQTQRNTKIFSPPR